MFRSVAIRCTAGLAVIAAVACSASASRAEAVSPVASTERCSVASWGGLTEVGPAAASASEAVMRSLASQSDAIGYHAGLSTASFGSQVVRHAPGMGLASDAVPFESFLSVAAAAHGKRVVRAFIILEDEKSKGIEAAPAEAAGDDLMNRFTQPSVGATTTSGSATLSILQVPPASSALVYTNVVLKGGRATE